MREQALGWEGELDRAACIMNAARVVPEVCYYKHWKSEPVVCRTWKSSRQAQGRAGVGGARMNAPVR